MRLINVESLTLEEFLGEDVPAYAILSHTWGDDEVTFQDFTARESLRARKQGFGKIARACSLAKDEGLKYAWVDTCCIDKTSSAELTEAINSMYRWYRDAVICFTWLADLPTECSAAGDAQPGKSTLSRCRWFRRGWTLQELIAPRVVRFYDETWTPCGTKESLGDVIAEITKVRPSVLADPEFLPTLSVAERMSWAATRTTTRVEDMAYCLLGIFDVNMPMLYGEGPRAFLRLQEEISKEVNDLSIFAWRCGTSNRRNSGLFAASPADFLQSGSIQLAGDTVYNPEFLITNKGLRMKADLFPGDDKTYVLMLSCDDRTADDEAVGVFVEPHGGGVYSRVRPWEFGRKAKGAQPKTHDMFLFRYLNTARSLQLRSSESEAFVMRRGFNMSGNMRYPDFPFSTAFIMPKEEWDSQRSMFLTHGAAEFFGYALFAQPLSARRGKDGASPGLASFLIAFGRTVAGDAWVSMFDSQSHPSAYANLYKASETLAAVRNLPVVHELYGRKRRGEAPIDKVTVGLERAEMDGKDVYCIDLAYVKMGQDGVAN